MAKRITLRLDQEAREVLSLARDLLRDLDYDWPKDELAEKPKVVCERITGLLGDRFDYERGEVIDG